MTTTELLKRLAPMTSRISRESAAIEVYGHNSELGPVWWISIRRPPMSDYREYANPDEVTCRRIASFDVDDGGEMVNIKPLPTAMVHDWDLVRQAIACGTDYMAGQICMLPEGHGGSHR